MAREYAATNENLNAIVLGLDVNSKDYILSVAGSGDQAFALLENAGKVLAVDIEHRQCNYIRGQVRCLADGDYEGFLRRRLMKDGKLEYLFEFERSSGTKYFDKKRLDRTRKKVSYLEIREANILDVCQNERGFNKIYLSNSLIGHPDELGPKLQIVSDSIPVGGLVYASNGVTI